MEPKTDLSYPRAPLGRHDPYEEAEAQGGLENPKSGGRGDVALARLLPPFPLLESPACNFRRMDGHPLLKHS